MRLPHETYSEPMAQPWSPDSKSLSILKVLVFVDVTQIILVAEDSSLLAPRPDEHQVPGGVAGEGAEPTARESRLKAPFLWHIPVLSPLFMNI